MGADLYIEVENSNDNEHYFRDSYNASAVLWCIFKKNGEPLSWWNDCDPLLNDQCRLVGDYIDEFRDLVADSEFRLPTREELEKRHAAISDSGDDSLERWHEYFTKKRDRLVEFLDRAIELKAPILCSI